MAAEVGYEGGIRFRSPVVLFDGPYTLDLMGHQRYNVSPDGRSFLMVENSDDFPIVVVQKRYIERVGDNNQPSSEPRTKNTTIENA